MKNALAILIFLVFSAVTVHAWENPACTLHSDNVTFHMTFDQGDCTADMAGGNADPSSQKSKIPVTFADKGVFGKAMKSGECRYQAAGNLDLSKPGTVIFWVSPTWETVKPANGKEPGFTAFSATGRTGDYEYDFIMGKMKGQPWGHGHINNYVQYRPASIRHVNCIRFTAGKTADWPRGEWRMFACTWKPGSFTNSVNGTPSVSSNLVKMTSGTTRFFVLKSPENILLDEVVILNKALTDEELAKIYRETINSLPKDGNRANSGKNVTNEAISK